MGLRTLLAALVLALTAGCVGNPGDDPADIVLGIGSTQEQQVLAAIAEAVLERADIRVERRPELGDTRGLRREALAGRIDLFWDYTGSAWALGLRQESPVADVEESYELVRNADEDRGLIWLAPTQANATLALFVRADEPTADQGRGMTWLAAELSGGAKPLCADPDFINRPGGLSDLAALYGMNLEQLDVVEAAQQAAIQAVADGTCFAGLAVATSGEARRQQLAPVSDDEGVFPAFVIAPVMRARALQAFPDVQTALDEVTGRISTETLAELNGFVAAGGDVEQVADDFVISLLGPPPT